MATDAERDPTDPGIPEEEQRVTEDATIVLSAGALALGTAVIGRFIGEPALVTGLAVGGGGAALLFGALSVLGIREPGAVGHLAFALPCAGAAALSVPPENLIAVGAYGLIAVMGLGRAYETTFGDVFS
jgi:hypothetical protein